MGKLQVIVGGQYGSEGKGAICAHLARASVEAPHLAAVRVAGPNAGHTVIGRHGKPYPLRHLPVAAVVRPTADLYIAAGSEIDLSVLAHEIRVLEADGYSVRDRLLIDRQATLLQDHHIAQETEGGYTARMGSTGKGIGAARMDRLQRTAEIVGDGNWALGSALDGVRVGDVSAELRTHLHFNHTVQIEGTQGFGLGLHAGHYPHCTSSDCRVIDFCAMAGISPWERAVSSFDPWVVCRTYPIRVAGNSGPMLRELSWADVRGRADGAEHIQPEKTTVTHKVRRVGDWDPALAHAAVVNNGGIGQVSVALTFTDYWVPALYRQDDPNKVREAMAELREWLQKPRVRRAIGDPLLLGTGPDTVIDLRRAVPAYDGQISIEEIDA